MRCSWWALRGSNPPPSPCKGAVNVLVRGLSRSNEVPLSSVKYPRLSRGCCTDVVQRLGRADPPRGACSVERFGVIDGELPGVRSAVGDAIPLERAQVHWFVAQSLIKRACLGQGRTWNQNTDAVGAGTVCAMRRGGEAAASAEAGPPCRCRRARSTSPRPRVPAYPRADEGVPLASRTAGSERVPTRLAPPPARRASLRGCLRFRRMGLLSGATYRPRPRDDAQPKTSIIRSMVRPSGVRPPARSLGTRAPSHRTATRRGRSEDPRADDHVRASAGTRRASA